MKENKQVRAVCSVFVKKENKFLLVYDPFFKKWRVPGGKLEKYETVEEACAREIREELAINIKNIKFIGFGQDAHIAFFKKLGFNKKCPRLILYFVAEAVRNEELNPDPKEISKLKWLSLDEIRDHKNKEGALDDLFKRNPGLVI